MDTVSHGLWSFIIWHALPFPLLAVLMGMLPDLVSISPLFFYNVLKGRKKETYLCEDNVPRRLKRYKDVAFLYTHSLVIASVAIGIAWLAWGIQWWMLAWPLHVLVDIFSHPREKATPFLWPILGTRVHGLKWWGKHFLALNGALLVAAYFRFVR